MDDGAGGIHAAMPIDVGYRWLRLPESPALVGLNLGMGPVQFLAGCEEISVMVVASLLGARLWEAVMLSAWLGGVWLVVRMGRTPFLVGIYTGCSAIVLWDWIQGEPWFFNIAQFDPHFVRLFTLAGRSQPMWIAWGYAAFFGIPTLLVLRHRHWLDSHLGRWQYITIGLAVGVSDFAVEGMCVGWLDLYRFGFESSQTLWGVPYLIALIYVPVALATMLFLTRRAADLVERAGMRVDGRVRKPGPVPVPDATPSGSGRSMKLAERVDAADTSGSTLPFWVGFPLPIAAIYVAIAATAPILDRMDPFTRLAR